MSKESEMSDEEKSAQLAQVNQASAVAMMKALQQPEPTRSLLLRLIAGANYAQIRAVLSQKPDMEAP